MTAWIGASPRSLDELEAFDAMRIFLDAYWRREGSRSDDLADLLLDLSRDVWANEMPGDMAQWNDFRSAVSQVISNRS